MQLDFKTLRTFVKVGKVVKIQQALKCPIYSYKERFFFGIMPFTTFVPLSEKAFDFIIPDPEFLNPEIRFPESGFFKL